MSPQLQKANFKKNINTEIDYSRCFKWFEDKLIPNLFEASQMYTNADINWTLLGITTSESEAWQGSDYFITQVPLTEKTSAYIKISDEAVQIVLDNTIGKRDNSKSILKLKTITTLESEIIIAYKQCLFESILGAIITKDKVLQKEKHINYIEQVENHLHFTFLLTSKVNNGLMGKIIISIPQVILKKPKTLAKPEEDAFSIDAFKHSGILTNIIAGKSFIKVEDLRHLEEEDILILENSNINKMMLSGQFNFQFNVNPEPSIIIATEKNYEGDDIMIQDLANYKEIWDDLNIEVGAEFKKIKLPLGDLKQMSEGLVVEVAPVVKNELFLKVENKSIASGELVIIGDKYGIKINKIFEEPLDDEPLTELGIKANEPTVNSAEAQEEMPQQEEETVQEDDFDYSDFEIDEE